MMPFLGGLLSGGASLLSGLFDKPKNNKGMMSSISKSNQQRIARANAQDEAWNKRVVADMTRVARWNNFDAAGMMKAAEKSGFNPVTFLNAGGIAAFTGRADRMLQAKSGGLSKPGYQAYIRDTGQLQQTGTTMGQAIGNALQSGVNTFLSISQQNDSQEFQKSLMQMQLAGVQRSATPANRLFSVPMSGGVETGRQVKVGGGNPSGGGGGFWWDQKPNTAGNPGGTTLRTGIGDWWLPGPDAQVIEDVLGESEIISGIYGGGRILTSIYAPSNWKRVGRGLYENAKVKPSGGAAWVRDNWSTWADNAKQIFTTIPKQQPEDPIFNPGFWN